MVIDVACASFPGRTTGQGGPPQSPGWSCMAVGCTCRPKGSKATASDTASVQIVAGGRKSHLHGETENAAGTCWQDVLPPGVCIKYHRAHLPDCISPGPPGWIWAGWAIERQCSMHVCLITSCCMATLRMHFDQLHIQIHVVPI